MTFNGGRQKHRQTVVSNTSPLNRRKISRLAAQAGVNIEVIYSDQQNRLILVVDDFEKGRAVSEAWEKESAK